MESLILKTLGFEVSVPTILNFLERFLKATECPVTDSPKVESLAKVSLIVTFTCYCALRKFYNLKKVDTRSSVLLLAPVCEHTMYMKNAVTV